MSDLAKPRRIDRLLVERGFIPRKVAQRLIRRGAVSTLCGVPLPDPKIRLSGLTPLLVDEVESHPPPPLVLWHKPLGCLSTYRDPWGREGLEGALPEPLGVSLHPVGRLDSDTSGLLLFARDGQLTQRLLHPKHQLPRVYRVTVASHPPELGERLKAGVRTSEGVFKAELLRAEANTLWARVYEGKYRMVRRIFANAGAPVQALHRESYGPFMLNTLSPREHRLPALDELAELAEGLPPSLLKSLAPLWPPPLTG